MGRVYVHCKAGRGRSASLVVAYLMLEHDWSLAKAFSVVRKSRPCIHFNRNQRAAVQRFVDAEKKIAA